MKRFSLLLSSIFAAVAASLCCILPLVLAGTGLGGLAAAAVFESWRPYLLALTAVLLVTGLALAYRESKRECAPGDVCAAKPKNRRNVLTFGVVAGLVVAIAAFPYYSGVVVQAMSPAKAKSKESTKGSLVTTSFAVTGMTCPSCASGLEASFRNLPGVKEARVDYDAKRATITYDTIKQNEQALKKLITDVGYGVKNDK